MSEKSSTTKSPVMNFKEEDAVALKERLISQAPKSDLQIVEAVRRARHVAGMTQAEYAAATGVSLPTLSSIERGKGSPTVATLNALLLPLGLQMGVVRAFDSDISGRPWRRPNVQRQDREVHRRQAAPQLDFDQPRIALTVQKPRQQNNSDRHRSSRKS